ncbi:MAG: type II CRISPR RNA-guided endonuclease Cas9 [Clostridia bacterium]|nr:type II CRISPR RNA-guided endonuclease Cas9 [Clostridia bacterium]
MKELKQLKLGLDIGTNSIGWALLDQDNELVQKNTKNGRFTFWGVRMFDESQDAKSRRTFRSSRRRIERRKQRLSWTREIFEDEINKIDPLFFERLNDSFLVKEDKKHQNKYNLFNDKNYNDSNFYKEYPTIYHLRKDLMKNKAKDIRFLYLAISHIIKYRGNFLTPGEVFSVDNNEIAKQFFELVNDKLSEVADSFSEEENFDECYFEKFDNFSTISSDFENIMLNNATKSDKKRTLTELFSLPKGSLIRDCLIPLLVGANVNISKLDIVKDEQYEKLELSLTQEDLEGKIEESKGKISELSFLFDLILEAKKVYDFYYVVKLLGHENKSISEAFVNKYYECINLNPNWKDTGKLRSSSNGAIPMQLHLFELKEILNTQKKYYSFLNNTSDGYSNIEKLVMIFKFKLPYYFGPLNDSSEHAWIKRLSYEHITPWNINKNVDEYNTAIAFIQRMQNKCTYLKGDNDYCLPKKSIIFQEYDCLSYLNKVSINGRKISTEEKQQLFEEVFYKYAKPTKKHIINFFNKESNGTGSLSQITTSTGKELPEVNCSMSSYIKFKSIFGGSFEENKDKIEDIILDLAIFEDKDILEKRLVKEYNLDNEIIKKIKGLNYSGFSSLSKKFINGININNQGTLLEIMRKTNLNLNEILYDKDYMYINIVNDYNKQYIKSTDNLIDFLKEYTIVSPKMTRAVVQSVHIIDEIERIFGRKIDKYYIECARTNKAKKKPSRSRYDKLKELYKESKNLIQSMNVDYDEINKELDRNKDNLRSDQIFLYFTQLGKCMYTMDNIDINRISQEYDVDHIYPQSLIKDDSLTNRVLTLRSFNNNVKKDKFLFEVADKMSPQRYMFYNNLLDKGLISKEKYRRLTQKTMTEAELDGFVNRQLTITNQSVKALVTVLKNYMNVNDNDIIESKAENISDFRESYDVYKSRTANNFHHAHDAYLNVVIGGIIDDYYKKHHLYYFKDYDRMKAEGFSINPNKIVYWYFRNDREKLNLLIKDLTSRFDIHETIRTYNPNILIPKVTILPKSDDNLIPIKKNLKTNIYGGLKSDSFSRYVIIEANKNNKKTYILEAIPKRAEKEIDNYLLRECGYQNAIVVCDNIKTNAPIFDGKLKYCITGKTGDAYVIKNLNDRIFNQKDIYTIKIIDKYLDNKKMKNIMLDFGDKVIVSPAKNEKCDEIVLTDSDLFVLFKDIKLLFSKDIYSFTIIRSISQKMDEKVFEVLSLDGKIKLLSSLLDLLKTNERKLADLSSIGLSKQSGVLKISKTLKPGQLFVSESITGFYKKTLFEVPK